MVHRQVSRHRSGAVSGGGSSPVRTLPSPSRLEAPYWQSTRTWTPSSGSSGLTRSSSARKDSGGLSGRFPGSSDQHPSRGVRTASPTASKQPINIERAKTPWAPGSGQNRRLCTRRGRLQSVDRARSAKHGGLGSGAPRRHISDVWDWRSWCCGPKWSWGMGPLSPSSSGIIGIFTWNPLGEQGESAPDGYCVSKKLRARLGCVPTTHGLGGKP